GLVLGEGAGMYVLEDFDHARARGAEILAEFAGAGMSADAGDIVLPSDTGAASAIQAALDDAGLNADEIDYINAHGTATPANDPTETRDTESVRRTRGFAGRVLHQVRARPRARRRRGDRVDRRDRCVARSSCAAHGQLPRSRSGMRPGLRTEHRTRTQSARRAVERVRVWRFECGGGA